MKSGVHVDLDIPHLTKEIKEACDKAAERGAKRVLRDAKSYLMSHAKHPTGKLAGEIKLESSKYKGGGYAVEAQGPGNYTRFYATFVELGSIRNPQPIPYLRNSLKANRKYINKQFEGVLD